MHPLRLSATLVATVLGTSCATSAHAGPVAAAQLEADLRSADTVLVGRVVDSGTVTDVDTMTRSPTWEVDRVLDGAPGLRPGDRVRVRLQGLVKVSGMPGDTSLLVLACHGSRNCIPANRERPGWPALPGGGRAAMPASPPTSLSFAVARELAAVVSAPDDAVVRSMAQPRVDAEQAMWEREDALEALRSLPPDDVRTALARSPATASSAAARLAYLAAWIQLEEAPDIASATADLLGDDASLAAARHCLAWTLVGSRERELGWVPALAQWLSARDVEVRRAAAYVLAEIPSDDAATALLSRGIVDDDREVRFHAVAGLVRRKGDGHSPGVEAFRSDEARWLAPWLARRASTSGP